MRELVFDPISCKQRGAVRGAKCFTRCERCQATFCAGRRRWHTNRSGGRDETWARFLSCRVCVGHVMMIKKKTHRGLRTSNVEHRPSINLITEGPFTSQGPFTVNVSGKLQLGCKGHNIMRHRAVATTIPRRFNTAPTDRRRDFKSCSWSLQEQDRNFLRRCPAFKPSISSILCWCQATGRTVNVERSVPIDLCLQFRVNGAINVERIARIFRTIPFQGAGNEPRTVHAEKQLHCG